MKFNVNYFAICSVVLIAVGCSSSVSEPTKPATVGIEEEVPAPLDSAPLDSAPLDSAPLDSAPLDSAPLDSAPLDSAPLDSAPLDSAPLDSAPPEDLTQEPGLGIRIITGTTAGSLIGSSSGEIDGIVRAIDSVGTTLFTRQFGSTQNDSVEDTKTTSGGDVAIVGTTAGDFIGNSRGGTDGYVIVYDSSGGITFRRQIGTSENDTLEKVVINEGNYVVAGTTLGSISGNTSGYSDIFFRMLDSQGTTLLTRQFGSELEDSLTALIVSTSGHIMLFGETQGALIGSSRGGSDAFVRVYDSDGNIVFTRQFGSEGNENVRDVALSPNGSIFIAGDTDGQLSGTSAGGRDAFVRVYDQNGNVQFTRQFGSNGDELVSSIALTENNRATISGTTNGALIGRNFGQSDVFLRMYLTDGSIGFTRQFGTASADSVSTHSSDSDGNYFIAGITNGSLSGNSAGSSDAYLRKYSASGNILLTRQFGSSQSETIKTIKIDPRGIISIAGVSNGSLIGTNSGQNDIFVRYYDPEGTILLTRQFGTVLEDQISNLTLY